MPPPDSIIVPSNQLASIAVEHWRLKKALEPFFDHPQLAAARHAMRKIDDFLKSCDLDVQSLEGLPYDPGLNARVVERILSPACPQGTAYTAAKRWHLWSSIKAACCVLPKSL